MINKRKVGSKWEEMACLYLSKRGYKILERNFYIKGGEADIIALDGEDLCFVEVKYRANNNYGFSLEAVDSVKMSNLIKVARYYTYSHKKYENCNIRFDCLGIDGEEITLIKGAFDAF